MKKVIDGVVSLHSASDVQLQAIAGDFSRASESSEVKGRIATIQGIVASSKMKSLLQNCNAPVDKVLFCFSTDTFISCANYLK